MIRILALVPALAALVLPPAPSPAPSPAGPGGVLAMHRDLFAAIDRGDAEAAAAFLAPDRKGPGGSTSLFLTDRSGAALDAKGAERSRDVLAKLAGDSKSAGGSFSTRITYEGADCPSAELSYAVLEFERAHATRDGKQEVRRYRSTSLVRHEDSKWKLAHWHVSAAPGAE